MDLAPFGAAAATFPRHHRHRNLSLYVRSWYFSCSISAMQKMFSLEKFVASRGRVFFGWLFLIVGAISFLSFVYAAVISKLQPPSHNFIICAIQNDWYCCFLVPLTLPILFVGVFSLAEHEVIQACLILLMFTSFCNSSLRNVMTPRFSTDIELPWYKMHPKEDNEN